MDEKYVDDCSTTGHAKHKKQLGSAGYYRRCFRTVTYCIHMICLMIP